MRGSLQGGTYESEASEPAQTRLIQHRMAGMALSLQDNLYYL